MDPTATGGVQPGVGQGANGDAPYAEYLNRIPEEHRPLVEPIFKEWDGNVTKRFQEHAERLKAWEPYQEAGLDRYDPQTLTQLVEFAQQLSDPVAYRDWVAEQAARLGLVDAGDEGDMFGEDDLLDPTVKSLLEQQAAQFNEQIEALKSQLGEFQTQAQRQAQQQLWEQQFAELAREHGELDRDVIEAFAARYADDPQNAIMRGFEDYQKLQGRIEQSLLNSKRNNTGGPSTLPGAAPPPKEPESLEEAEAMFRKRLEESMSF